MAQLIKTIEADGEKVILRYPTLSDCRKLQKFINQGIRESLQGGGYLGRTNMTGLKDEREWLKDVIKKIKARRTVYIMAEYKNRVVGAVDVRREPDGATEHIGNFGIVILEEFTGKGLGTKMIGTILDLAKKILKVEIVQLSVYENNKRAQGLYKKMGFREMGRIKKGRKIKGVYKDNILMVKYL